MHVYLYSKAQLMNNFATVLLTAQLSFLKIIQSMNRFIRHPTSTRTPPPLQSPTNIDGKITNILSYLAHLNS